MEVEKNKVCPNCNGSGVYQEYDEYDRYYVHSCATCDGSGEIARQSATSEEVQRAIEQLKYAREQDREFDDGTFVDSLDLAITALQAYQPTTRKDRTVEEVAIFKTETTSARALSCWYCTEIEKHGVVAVKTVLDKAGRELDAYNTPYNYCPNCGRKIKGD